MRGVAQPGVPVAGEHHAPITVAERAFGAGSADAAGLGHTIGHCVLAAEAVLQQDQFRFGVQAMGYRGHGRFRVVGFAGQ
ncbi:hypothetical protein D3C80_2076380 [compost metagenome]